MKNNSLRQEQSLVDKNEILENSLNGSPELYLHGTADTQKLLQEQLEGLLPGDRKQLFLPATSCLMAGGLSFEVIIDNVRNVSGEESLLGYPVQIGVDQRGADCPCFGESAEKSA